jgi:cytidyltransferase-like protein
MSTESGRRFSIGLVLGRFEYLHPGHVSLLRSAFEECDEVVVCIGSAQIANPFSITERHADVARVLCDNWSGRRWRIVELVDPESMESWPGYVTERCSLGGDGPVGFFSGDTLPESEEAALEDRGYVLRYVKRKAFCYELPCGACTTVSSSSEIRAALAAD